MKRPLACLIIAGTFTFGTSMIASAAPSVYLQQRERTAHSRKVTGDYPQLHHGYRHTGSGQPIPCGHSYTKSWCYDPFRHRQSPKRSRSRPQPARQVPLKIPGGELAFRPARFRMCPSCFDGEWSALTFAIKPLVEVRAVAWSDRPEQRRRFAGKRRR